MYELFTYIILYIARGIHSILTRIYHIMKKPIRQFVRDDLKLYSGEIVLKV
jgi:hypothetical protein